MLAQNLTINVSKHISIGIFPLRRFEHILRRGVKLFTGEACKLHLWDIFYQSCSCHAKMCFRHKFNGASLLVFSKTCWSYYTRVHVVVGSKFHCLFMNFPEKQSSTTNLGVFGIFKGFAGRRFLFLFLSPSAFPADPFFPSQIFTCFQTERPNAIEFKRGLVKNVCSSGYIWMVAP